MSEPTIITPAAATIVPVPSTQPPKHSKKTTNFPNIFSVWRAAAAKIAPSSSTPPADVPLKWFVLLMSACGIMVCPKMNRQFPSSSVVCADLNRLSLVWSATLLALHTVDLAAALRHFFYTTVHSYEILEPVMLQAICVLVWRVSIYTGQFYMCYTSVKRDGGCKLLWRQWRRLARAPDENPSIAHVMAGGEANVVQWLAVVTGVALSVSVSVVLIAFGMYNAHKVMLDGSVVYPFQHWPVEYAMSVVGRVQKVLLMSVLGFWWMLPMAYYVATCGILRRTFARFEEQTKEKLEKFCPTIDSVELGGGDFAKTLEHVRMQHFRLCSLVKQADASAAPSVGIFMIFLIPLMCISVFLLNLPWNVVPSSSTTTTDGGTSAMSWFWVVCAAIALSSLALAGGMVSETVTRVRDIVAGIGAPADENGGGGGVRGCLALMMLLMQVSDTTTGMTAGHVFTLNKQSLLTLAGAFLTYYLLLVQMGDGQEQSRRMLDTLTNVTGSVRRF